MAEENMAQRIACKAIIAKDGKVLVLREASTYDEGVNVGKYDIPGGRVEMGEPFREGLLREVREETGLEVTIGEPIFVGEWFPIIKGVKTQIVAIFFVCIPEPGVITLSIDHDDYRWVTVEQARQLPISPPGVEVIEKYLNNTTKA